MDCTRASKYLSRILRHDPAMVGIALDEHGYLPVDALLNGMARAGKYPLTPEELRFIVRTDAKQRYSFSPDGTRIRANQGHSIPVDLELPASRPPETLLHGTASRFLPSIRQKGLLRGDRLYVHLSRDLDTARTVGARHGRPVVLTVDAARMAADGLPFFHSANGVWLTEHVPPQYLTFPEV